MIVVCTSVTSALLLPTIGVPADMKSLNFAAYDSLSFCCDLAIAKSTFNRIRMQPKKQ